jgi:EF hand
MKNTHFIGAGALALVLGAAAFALPAIGEPSKADADGNGVISKAEALATAEARFAAMDANGDGRLTIEDRAARVKKRFTEMDGDKNGAVTEAEFMAADAARKERRGARDAKWDGEGGDGHRGRGGQHGGRHGEGHGGGHDGHGMAMMKAADSNGDKAVTLAEYRAAAETRFIATDSDKNGGLSETELQAARAKRHAERTAMAR